MKVRIELTQADLYRLAVAEVSRQLGTLVSEGDSRFVVEVKSKQNYRSEWEPADYRAYMEIIA